MKTLNELKLAKELIKFPSITPIDAGVMKFLEKKLKKLGFKTKILNSKKKVPYLFKIYMQDLELRDQIYVTQVTWMSCPQEI